MKKFLIKISAFSFFIIGMVWLYLFSLQHLVEKEGFYQLDENITTIIVGDSHAETAYNDSLIPNFRNFGQSGDVYFYTYLRTKKILQENPQVERVFIEFNNGQLLPSMDQHIWGNEHVVEKYRKYCTEMSLSEQWMMLTHNFKDVVNARILRAQMDFSLMRYHENRSFEDYEWGEYERLEHVAEDDLNLLSPLMDFNADTLIVEATPFNFPNLFHQLAFLQNNKVDVQFNRLAENASDQSFWIQVIAQRQPDDTDLIDLPELNMKYLVKTIEVCKEHEVDVILIRTPFHKGYAGALNEVSFLDLLGKDFKDIPFLDFKDFPIANDEYSDTHHMNYKGAQKFSEYFSIFINSERSLQHRFIFEPNGNE